MFDDDYYFYYIVFGGSGLTVICAIIFFGLILRGFVANSTAAMVGFIEKYYVIISIVLGIISAIISVVIFFIQEKEVRLLRRITCCLSSFLALCQNGFFLVYGLYNSLLSHSESVFLTMLLLIVFVILYIVDSLLTFGSIFVSVEFAFGFIASLLLTPLGTLFIYNF